MNPEKEPDYIIYDPKAQSKSIQQTAATTHTQEDSDNQEEYIDECSFQFANLENKSTVTLGKYDQKKKYLTVYPGLNLKGQCSNPQCVAFNKQTWIKFGFGVCNIGKLKSRSFCPCCKQKIGSKTITTFGFTRAEIVVEGTKYQGQQQVAYSKSFEEREGKFTYFKDYDGDKIQWLYMEVTVKEIQ